MDQHRLVAPEIAQWVSRVLAQLVHAIGMRSRFIRRHQPWPVLACMRRGIAIRFAVLTASSLPQSLARSPTAGRAGLIGIVSEIPEQLRNIWIIYA
jgi:hypothetical protein